MLSRYKCVICQSKPDQLSHHKSHLKTDKHKNKHEILKLQLKQLPKKELKTKYGSEDIDEILKKFESKKILTLTKKWKIKKTTSTTLTKKKKTNKLIFEKSKNVISDTEHNESFKKTFLDFLGKMHNLLRGAGVTCEPALDDILNCLFLCYIEDKISDEGEFDL